MQLSDAATVLGAKLNGSDQRFTGVSTDTRTLQQGALFAALRGPHFNGHDFITQACRKGAVGILAERTTVADVPILQVRDSRDALGELAAAWRAGFTIPVVGVTGSNGKTSVKEMIAHIFALEAPVLATRGNLNNDIGVPQTLFELDQAHRAAVIEMGADRVGDIQRLGKITQPTVGVVTLCAAAHLESFGSIENIAKTKGELYTSLDEKGIAIINADDAYADYWRELARPRQIITFGLDAPADVYAADIVHHGFGNGSEFTLCYGAERVAIQLPLEGRHNVANALAAAAVAYALECDSQAIKRGLESVAAVAGRMTARPALRGGLIVDDSYNANPTSLNAALDVVTSSPDEAWLVLGDMCELGREEVEFHRQAGERARELGIARLFSYGALASHASQAFGSGAMHFDELDELIETLEKCLKPRVTVLIKGSRAMRMERVSQALADGAPQC